MGSTSALATSALVSNLLGNFRPWVLRPRVFRPRDLRPRVFRHCVLYPVTSITALDGLFRKYTLSPPSQIGTDFHGALIHSIDRFTEIIESNLGTGIKFGLEISLNISRHSTGASATRPFDSQMMPLLLTDPVEPVIRMQIDIICARIERLIRDGSRWAVIDVNSVSIRITK